MEGFFYWGNLAAIEEVLLPPFSKKIQYVPGSHKVDEGVRALAPYQHLNFLLIANSPFKT
jgi:hypothetical protein